MIGSATDEHSRLENIILNSLHLVGRKYNLFRSDQPTVLSTIMVTQLLLNVATTSDIVVHHQHISTYLLKGRLKVEDH